MLDAAVEADVNLIDPPTCTADLRRGDRPRGTEEIVGRWLKRAVNRAARLRHETLRRRMGDGMNDRGLSAVHIRAAVDASLRRLAIDRIDLIQMHHIDRDVPVDEVLDAFSVLPPARHYGLGVLPWSPLEGDVLSGVLSRRFAGHGRSPRDRQSWNACPRDVFEAGRALA